MAIDFGEAKTSLSIKIKKKIISLSNGKHTFNVLELYTDSVVLSYQNNPGTWLSSKIFIK